MINADHDQLAAHMAMQRNTRREVVDGISRTKAVADSLRQRNVIYETVDLKQVGFHGTTTTEFRRAAKSKAALEHERRIREGKEEDTAQNKVFEMFKKTYQEASAAHD